MIDFLIFALVGIVTGTMAGLFGVGGGLIIVPVMHYILTANGVIESIDLEWLDPIDDAAPVGITKMEEIPSDASDLAKEYGESHAAEVQDWWLKLRNVY